MDLFEINEDKCNQDGICAQVCPLKVIEFTDNQFPAPSKKAQVLCIGCGHCVAVCPAQAFTNTKIETGTWPPVQEELLLSPEQIEHHVRYRRSVRTYKDKPIDKETITRVLDIAAHAPTGHNLQKVYWKIFSGHDRIRDIGGIAVDWMRSMLEKDDRFDGSDVLKFCVMAWEQGIDVVCRQAPHLVITHAPEDVPTGNIDCIIALTHLDLIAPAFGLGTCWAGILNMGVLYWPPMLEALGLPDTHQFHAGMMLGYPKYKYHRLPPRNRARITWG